MTVSNSRPITAELIASHGLKPDEYDRILNLIGREPTFTELGIFSAMWNEHCSYKHTKPVLRRFPTDAKLAPGSFFWMHTGFTALHKSGCYDDMPKHLGPWHESVGYGLSTFVEENSYWRSLCHAWSAHPVLEFQQRILGVTPAEPGFARVRGGADGRHALRATDVSVPADFSSAAFFSAAAFASASALAAAASSPIITSPSNTINTQ